MLLLLLKLEWTDAGDFLTLIVGFILGAAAVITAVTLIWAKIIKPFYEKWIKPIQEVEQKRIELTQSIDDVKGQLNTISAELKTNGGESLKDIVNRIESKLDYTTNKLRFRDQLSPNAVFEMDSLAKCTFANRALCEQLDIDENEFLERRWLSKINEVDKAHLLSEWLDAISNKIPLSVTYKFSVKNQTKTALIRAEPNLNRKGDLEGFMCLVDFH